MIYFFFPFPFNGKDLAPFSFKVLLPVRCVAEFFLLQVLFSKIRAGLLKYYTLNVILDLFKVPSYEYVQIITSTM